MLKMIIQTEAKNQGIARAVLFDGICTEEEFFLWEQEEEPEEENFLGVMQIHAITQRLGKSVDKYDAILGEAEDFLAQKRNAIWRWVRAGKLEEAGKAVAEYRDFLNNWSDFSQTDFGQAFRAVCEKAQQAFPTDLQAGMPAGEEALQRQFLALSQAEIARRKALPYQEQMEFILSGLCQTIPKAAWEERQGKFWPSRAWFRMRRLHLMEQFLLARFAWVWECMEKERGSEEIFLWYQEFAAYVNTTVKDQADKRKLYPLLCYRMAENRLHRMFGEDAWWEESLWWTKTISNKKDLSGTEKTSKKKDASGQENASAEEAALEWKVEKYELSVEEILAAFMELDVDEQGRFRSAMEYMWILNNFVDALKDISMAQKQFPLFCKIERIRLSLMRRIPVFGEHTAEENTWLVLNRAWEGLCKAAVVSGIAVDENNLDLDYMERSIHNFRELLGERMELHGWSIYELGEGIYADPKKSLIPILQGKANPKSKKRKDLQTKLGIDWKKYDPGFLTNDDAEYKKYARMARAYSEGRIEEGRKLLEELKEKMDWKYLTNEQFVQYWEALFDWKSMEITEEEKNKEMWKILEYSGMKRERFAEVGGSLTKTEWRALIEIAWNYEGEDLMFLCQVMKKQKEYLEKTTKASFFPEYYIKILYCLCCLEQELKNLDEAEQYVNEGLCAIYEMNLYTQWGAFLFEKFRIIEERRQGEMKEGDFEYIRQSYAVEKLFLESNAFCEYIEKYINKNYEQDILADIRWER